MTSPTSRVDGPSPTARLRRSASSWATTLAVLTVLIASCGLVANQGRSVVELPAATRSELQGLPVGMDFGDSLSGRNPAAVDRTLAHARSIGVDWIRVDMSWPDIQPVSASSFNWKPMDTIVAAANRHHLHVLGIVDYTPPWARGPGCTTFNCPPGDNQQFAAYAAALVRRYSPRGVRTYEVWNEPNINLFWVDPDAVAYRNLLITTAGTMRAADPRVTLLLGGLAATTTTGPHSIAAATFVRRACAGGMCPVDGVSYHPYTYPQLPQQRTDPLNSWQLMASTAPHGLGLRAAMRAVGLGSKPIWITEFGAPSRYPGAAASLTVTAARQAAIIINGLRLAARSRSYIGGYFVDTWQDVSARGAAYNHFGIFDLKGRPKPAVAALHRALNPG